MSVGSVSGAFWGPGQADPGQRWEYHVLQFSPSHLQRCVKAIPRAQKMRCACGQASAAADMATSVPTATLVSVGQGGVGCWRETREIGLGWPWGLGMVKLRMGCIRLRTQPLTWFFQSARASSGGPTARRGAVATRTDSART